MSYEHDKLIAQPCEGLSIFATVADGKLWRCWLKDNKGKTIAEAISDSTLKELEADPKEWTRKALKRRDLAIKGHIGKLERQIQALSKEASGINALQMRMAPK